MAPGAENGARTVNPLTNRVPPTAYRVALLGVVLLLVVVAYYPFRWDPPRMVTNGVTRRADGSLQFANMNYARTKGSPAWLNDVRTSGAVNIRVVFDPHSWREDAAIMILASNFWRTDFAIGQNGPDLMVWLRRPGSDLNGGPPFAIPGVISARRWNTVDVVVQHNEVHIVCDGSTKLAEHLRPGLGKDWGPGQVSLGNEVHGGGSWHGTIRIADVSSGAFSVDYVRAGTLSVPTRYFYFPDHVIPFPPSSEGWIDFTADMSSFVPVGFLIVYARRAPLRPVWAALWAALLAVILAAGKFLFHGRHTSIAMVVMQALGGLLGALLAWHLTQAQPDRREPAVASDG